METKGPEGWEKLYCKMCAQKTWHMPMDWLPFNRRWKCGGCGEYWNNKIDLNVARRNRRKKKR